MLDPSRPRRAVASTRRDGDCTLCTNNPLLHSYIDLAERYIGTITQLAHQQDHRRSHPLRRCLLLQPTHQPESIADSLRMDHLQTLESSPMSGHLDVGVRWQEITVISPRIPEGVAVIAAREIPHRADGHRLQTFNIYIPKTPSNAKLVGEPAKRLPSAHSTNGSPRYHVHVHGGAWRDPLLTARSIEPTVAHAFSANNVTLDAVVGINYTISPFPNHPTAPYDPWESNDPTRIKVSKEQRDKAREARHPAHVRDVLAAFELLRAFGLRDDGYILSGHSCGACIAFQTVLQPPSYWGVFDISPAPRPAALIGMNGLYDLPDLVHNLSPSHEHLSETYRDLQNIAFGAEESVWTKASPARFAAEGMAIRLKGQMDSIPPVVLVDQSEADQLVPMNQMTRMRQRLQDIAGMRVVVGARCVDGHAAPWEQGFMIWDTVCDVLQLIGTSSA